MRVLLTLEDHYKFLNSCVAESPETVSLCTFGLYAGILPNGQDNRGKYPSQTREFLEAVRELNVPTKILVGLSDYKSCRGKTADCTDCERKYVLDLVRLLNHAEAFPGFKWRISTGIQTRCAVFTYPEGADHTIRAATGGRNLTDSDWADVTVELDKMSSMRVSENFGHLWTGALILNSDRVGRFVESQGISEKTMAGIMAGV